jgi:hypothetical protein
MNHDKSNEKITWFEKWLQRIFMVLALPALVVFVYLTVLESRSTFSLDGNNDSSDRVLQEITCPGVIVKNQYSAIYAGINNLNPEKTSTVSVSIYAPSFDLLNQETSFSCEKMTSNNRCKPFWYIVPTQAGRQFVTISAVTDEGVKEELTCHTTVISFPRLNLGEMFVYSALIAIIGIYFGVKWLRQKQILFSK